MFITEYLKHVFSEKLGKILVIKQSASSGSGYRKILRELLKSYVNFITFAPPLLIE